MNFDLARKTEMIRRKVKTILFDRENRRLSDKMYDDLGEFFEKLNEEGVLIPEKYYDKLNEDLNKLHDLNVKRVDTLQSDMDKDIDRIDNVIEKNDKALDNAFNMLGIEDDNDFANKVGR